MGFTVIGAYAILGKGWFGSLAGSSLCFGEVLVLVTHDGLKTWLARASNPDANTPNG